MSVGTKNNLIRKTYSFTIAYVHLHTEVSIRIYIQCFLYIFRKNVYAVRCKSLRTPLMSPLVEI